MASKRKKQKKRARGNMAKNVRKTADKRKQGARAINAPSGTSFMEVKGGTQRFRVVPYEVSVKKHPQGIEPGDFWYEKLYGIHYKIGPGEQTVICPKKTIGAPCPICEEYSRLQKDPDIDDDVKKQFKPRVRQLFNVFIKDEVQLLDHSFHNFGKELEEEIREGDEEFANFACPDEGFLLKVRWSEEDLGGNKFYKAGRIDFEEDDPLEDEILEEALDLDKIVPILSYEAIEEILKGREEDEDEDDDDEEDERPSRARARKRKSRRDEDYDDIDEDEDEDEEEDDIPYDYEVEDEDDEEEDEEPPKRSRRRRRR